MSSIPDRKTRSQQESYSSEGSVNSVTVNVTIFVKLKNIILYLTVANELYTAAANTFSTTELNKTPFAFGIFNFIILLVQKTLDLSVISASLQKRVDYRNIYILHFKAASERLNTKLNLGEKLLLI